MLWMDKTTVDNFFTLYQDMLKTHWLEKAPRRVYNADENGFTLDPQRNKIVTCHSVLGTSSSDQHSANVTPAAIEVALKHSIILIGFPPHSSHFIQPMHARGGPFASLKSKFRDVVQNLNNRPNWLVMNKQPGGAEENGTKDALLSEAMEQGPTVSSQELEGRQLLSIEVEMLEFASLLVLSLQHLK
ncbi:hypothetical protein Bbelb_316620 [Branchiostoma belcheri]|nr:hypothetical protein Bbelb_316620 [Branchiostoma belcheri]